MSKYGHLTGNWFEAVINRLGGEEGAKAFLRGELVVSEPVQRWTTDSDGLIRFKLTGLGFTGPEWISRLESKGHELSTWAKDILSSSNFVSCEKGKVYNLTVLPGKLFSDEERKTKNIRVEADHRGLIHGENLPTEIGCLIRENFTNEEIKQMGLNWLVTMHEPVKDSDGDPFLLCTLWDGGWSWLGAGWGEPGIQWHREHGFVFLASQVSSRD
ncbi:hypothetical protein KKC45_02115 [Patescibacteria group bacterium]|nr:hypothetical protein [Patescibacteria group bacterium]